MAAADPLPYAKLMIHIIINILIRAYILLLYVLKYGSGSTAAVWSIFLNDVSSFLYFTILCYSKKVK